MTKAVVKSLTQQPLPLLQGPVPSSQPQPQQQVNQSVDYDIAIVGGGIIGATLACALKDSGLRIALIEAQPQSEAVAKAQAYSLSILSSRIYQGLGLWSKMAAAIAPYRKILLSDATNPTVVEFLPQHLNTEVLGYVAEHQVLLQTLQEALQASPNVQWLCPAKVLQTDYYDSEVTITLAATETLPTSIRARLVVAADGWRSPIRQAAGLKTQGWFYWQSCIVATVAPEHPHKNIAYERFWPSGPFAILPLPGNRCRIVWTAPHAEAKALAALPDEKFLQELQQRYGNHMGRLSLVGDRYVYPVRLFQSNRYILPRLALIGDAAHCCHPVGGQGLNLGIRDAAALAQVLTAAHHQGQDVGQYAVLQEYQRWRWRENLVILGFTDVLDRLFSNRWLPVVMLRRLGLWLLQRIHPLKVYALKLMTGLRGRMPDIAKLPER